MNQNDFEMEYSNVAGQYADNEPGLQTKIEELAERASTSPNIEARASFLVSLSICKLYRQYKADIDGAWKQFQAATNNHLALLPTNKLG